MSDTSPDSQVACPLGLILEAIVGRHLASALHGRHDVLFCWGHHRQLCKGPCACLLGPPFLNVRLEDVCCLHRTGEPSEGGLLGPRLVIVENPLCLPAGVCLPKDLTGGLLLHTTGGNQQRAHPVRIMMAAAEMPHVCVLGCAPLQSCLANAACTAQLMQSQGHSGGAKSDRCSQAAVPICWELYNVDLAEALVLPAQHSRGLLGGFIGRARQGAGQRAV